MSLFDDAVGMASVVSPALALFNGCTGNPAAEKAFQQGDAFLNSGGGLALDAAGLIPRYGVLADAAQAGYHFSHSMYSAGRGNFREAGSELVDAALNTLTAATGGGLTVPGKILPKVQRLLAKTATTVSTTKDLAPFFRGGGGPTEYTDPPPPSEQQLDGGAPPGGAPDVGAPVSSSPALPPMVSEAPALFKDHPAWMYAD